MDRIWDYSTRFSTELLADGEHAACSPLGAALLAALFGNVNPRVSDQFETEFGTPGHRWRTQMEQLATNPHPNVALALALWSNKSLLNPTFNQFEQAVPTTVATGPVPTQQQADQWASNATDGMVERLPVDTVDDTMLVAASALATNIRWLSDGFIVGNTPADSGPLFTNVERVLHGEGGKLYDTPAAGRVAVHHERSVEGITVTSVMSVDDAVPADVITEAHHILQGHYTNLSLYNLPLGDHGPYRIEEVTVSADLPDVRPEPFDVTLPRWVCNGPDHDLLNRDNTGFGTVLQAAMSFAGKQGAQDPQANQFVYADYDTYGFSAAAVTAMAMAMGMAPQPISARKAHVTFDRPHVAIAHVTDTHGNTPAIWNGLPLFTAWVAQATEPT